MSETSANSTDNAPPSAAPIKPTKAEHAQRVNLCRQMVGQAYHDGEIKRLVSQKYNISPRSVERYIKRARDQIIAELGIPKVELRAQSAEFYRSVAHDAKQKTRDRLRARERIDKLYGLDSPIMVSPTDPEGGPLTFAALLVASQELPAAPAPAAASNVVDVEALLAGHVGGNGHAGNGHAHHNGHEENKNADDDAETDQ